MESPGRVSHRVCEPLLFLILPESSAVISCFLGCDLIRRGSGRFLGVHGPPSSPYLISSIFDRMYQHEPLIHHFRESGDQTMGIVFGSLRDVSPKLFCDLNESLCSDGGFYSAM
jgi:hypothetical protein